MADGASTVRMNILAATSRRRTGADNDDAAALETTDTTANILLPYGFLDCRNRLESLPLEVLLDQREQKEVRG